LLYTSGTSLSALTIWGVDIVSDVQFCVSMARALLPNLEKAAVFVKRAIADTVDQRLRFHLLPVLSAIARNDAEAAARWLDRAISYERSRRPSNG
jgi:hypothetical protein